MEKEIASPLTLAKKKENLKQRAYLNSLTSIIDFAVTQLTGFIVSPFIVSGLGSSMYGVWQMLGQMTGYAKIADTRATQVLKWTVAKKKDIADEEELRSDVTSAFAITLFIIPLVLVAGGIASWYAPTITKVELEYYTLIRVTCSLMILSLVVTKLFDLYESVLRGMNLSFKRMGLRAGVVAAGGALKVLVLTHGYGLIGLSVVQVLIAFVIGVTYYITVKKTVSWFGFGKTNFLKIKRFSKISSWYLADTSANLLLENSDKILLGILAGPVVVTYYTLTLFLPLALQGMINRIILGIVPGIGKLLGLEEYDRVQKVIGSINNITYLFTTAAGVTIIFLNHSFLNAWVGEGMFAGNIANTLIMVLVVQDTFIKHDSYIISATLDLREKVILTVAAGAAFLIIGYIIVGKLGIIGLCISLLIGKFILLLGQQRILKRKIQGALTKSVFERARPVVVSLTMLTVAGFLSVQIKILSLLEMVGLAPVVFLATLVVFAALGLTRGSRKEIFQLLLSIKLLKSD
ncbi:lipopolysaccharide biosynthesis protein [Pontibacter litorisediminis]|uniref:lipopolysaccharide biosynthesis protein n=1 Tax=Pontibacter litorisediminis TaxID=1846260 RepID=UPI0023EBFCD4|nr:oligosaccharide flippase family protein [Pontibacter litorisediminis]